MSLISDLRLDIGDDLYYSYPTGVPITESGLMIDLRLDIGDDDGVVYPSGLL